MRAGAERLLGGAAFSRALENGARLEVAPPRGGDGTSRGARCSRILDLRVGNGRAEKFSNHWKVFFQSLENSGKFFPIVGKQEKNFSNRWKIQRVFSNHWKVFFQSLENFSDSRRLG